MIRIEIGENIRAYRRALKYTQEEVAQKMNVSAKTISSWEIDRTQPNVGQLERLAAIFECEKSDLVGETIPKATPGSGELLDLFFRATPEQQQAVLNLLRSFVSDQNNNTRNQ